MNMANRLLARREAGAEQREREEHTKERGRGRGRRRERQSRRDWVYWDNVTVDKNEHSGESRGYKENQ